jgi:hypothetical protein
LKVATRSPFPCLGTETRGRQVAHVSVQDRIRTTQTGRTTLPGVGGLFLSLIIHTFDVDAALPPRKGQPFIDREPQPAPRPIQLTAPARIAR